MAPPRGSTTFLFFSSQEMSRLCLVPLKGFLWLHSALQLVSCICWKHTFLRWSLIVKSQQNRIELVTRPACFQPHTRRSAHRTWTTKYTSTWSQTSAFDGSPGWLVAVLVTASLNSGATNMSVSGLAKMSIFYVLFFSINNLCKQMQVALMHNEGLHQLFLTVSWDLRAHCIVLQS